VILAIGIKEPFKVGFAAFVMRGFPTVVRPTGVPFTKVGVLVTGPSAQLALVVLAEIGGTAF